MHSMERRQQQLSGSTCSIMMMQKTTRNNPALMPLTPTTNSSAAVLPMPLNGETTSHHDSAACVSVPGRLGSHRSNPVETVLAEAERPHAAGPCLAVQAASSDVWRPDTHVQAVTCTQHRHVQACVGFNQQIYHMWIGMHRADVGAAGLLLRPMCC